MPRYYIDIHDGTHLVRDRAGFDLPDLAAARGQAARVMTRIAAGLAEAPDRQDYVVAVRDADGRVRLRLRMSLDVEPPDVESANVETPDGGTRDPGPGGT